MLRHQLFFSLVVCFTLLFLAPSPALSAQGSSAGGAGTFTLHVVPSGGTLRWYRVYTPSAYTPSQQYPVVVCFHGGGGNAQSAINNYGIAEEAEDRGWIAVFPEGTNAAGSGSPPFIGQTWNGGNCCGSSPANGIDDVLFFEDMMLKIAQDYSIVPGRVFATGFSNGGIMSYRLGVDRPDLVAGIVPVGGSLQTTTPQSPVPILAIHGALDLNVPIDGGVGIGPGGVNLQSQAGSILPFLSINGGAVPNHPTITVTNGLFFAVEGPPTGAPTWYYLAEDGGHTWPGGAGAIVNPLEPIHQTVPATPLMFDFFEYLILTGRA
jgi:polyhydroxybutyrate depolymerase